MIHLPSAKVNPAYPRHLNLIRYEFYLTRTFGPRGKARQSPSPLGKTYRDIAEKPEVCIKSIVRRHLN